MAPNSRTGGGQSCTGPTENLPEIVCRTSVYFACCFMGYFFYLYWICPTKLNKWYTYHFRTIVLIMHRTINSGQMLYYFCSMFSKVRIPFLYKIPLKTMQYNICLWCYYDYFPNLYKAHGMNLLITDSKIEIKKGFFYNLPHEIFRLNLTLSHSVIHQLVNLWFRVLSRIVTEPGPQSTPRSIHPEIADKGKDMLQLILSEMQSGLTTDSVLGPDWTLFE